MDDPNQPNTNSSRSITAAPDPSEQNSYSGAAALRGFMANERNEVMMGSSREAMLEQELEKQRIREEMLMDMMRKREIEAELLRELAMEEMALRRGETSLLMSRSIAVDYGVTEAHPEPRSAGLDRPNGVSLTGGGIGLTGQILEPRLAVQEKPMGVSLRDILPSSTKAEADNVPLPFQRWNDNAVQTVEHKAKPQEIAKPYSALVGIKRKSDFEESESSSKKKTNVLRCTLCNISCTSKKNHRMHLRGRKHRNKAEMGLYPINAMDKSSLDMIGVVGCSSAKEKGPEMDPQRKWKLENLKQRFAFICSVCVIGCESEDIMMKHCNGSKHAKKLAALKLRETSASNTLEHKKAKSDELESTEQMAHGTGEVGLNEGIGEVVWQRVLVKLADTIPARDLKNDQKQLLPGNQELITTVKAVPNIQVYTRKKRVVSGSKMADGADEVGVAVGTTDEVGMEEGTFTDKVGAVKQMADSTVEIGAAKTFCFM